MSPLASIDLPLDLGEQPLMSIYMVFQPIGRTAEPCCHAHGELLPRLFTLTKRAWRLFSVTLPQPRDRLPVRKYGALRCPDFPLALRQATNRPAI